MKKIVIAAVAAAIAVPAAAAPGDSATANGTATAEIVAPIAIVHDTGAALDFGLIVPGTAAGTVVVDAAGNGTDGGDATLLPGSTTAADSFTVTGVADATYSIVTGTGSLTGPGTAMAFSTAPSAPTGTLTGGTDSFTVGGTLTVGANQAGGTYTGSYTATVAYN